MLLDEKPRILCPKCGFRGPNTEACLNCGHNLSALTRSTAQSATQKDSIRYSSTSDLEADPSKYGGYLPPSFGDMKNQEKFDMTLITNQRHSPPPAIDQTNGKKIAEPLDFSDYVKSSPSGADSYETQRSNSAMNKTKMNAMKNANLNTTANANAAKIATNKASTPYGEVKKQNSNSNSGREKNPVAYIGLIIAILIVLFFR